MITKKELAGKIDHTLLGPEATLEKVKEVTQFAIEYETASVCVSPDRLQIVSNMLKDSSVLACTVIGFPHGTQTTASKVAEAEEAAENGADELDMVINVGHLKDGNNDYVKKDIQAVVQATDKVVKVIIETSLLTEEEKIKACQLAEEAGADFVKTSTGYTGGGATAEDVKLMRETVSDALQVKASGGIRSLEGCLKMLEAGADRIGASRSRDILAECDA
ncbi:MAG: deoxyribose-phosphate aldolase [Atopococcus tabaci]|uniref:Deoxyribose-phosphate aldolase n=1 Tax=Atopococcus tabaci TaxID=269774 RepID=A0AA43UBU2_9LACT|nr:deoxyribose-phosphate aldolase [Atopococcus tabaci]